MAIKAGQILHDIHGYVIDRGQTIGAGNVNIPQEKIYELGNYQTVATIRDIPDLSFDLESFDVSTEIEAVVTGADPTTVSAGQKFDFADAKPIDVISPFKDRGNSYSIIRGIATPYLNLERVVYRFGLTQNATQQYTFRGDSIYYIPGTPKQQQYTNTGANTYTFAQTAIEYVESGSSIYALSVCLTSSTSNNYKRLVHGSDYTDTSGGFTLTANTSGTYDRIHVVYGTATAGSYPQNVHQGVSVKPAAVRGKDIDVYISDGAATPTLTRFDGVQSFEVTRSVTLQNDDEFGNHHHVSTDYDVADVSGTVGVKSSDAVNLWDKIAQIASVATNKIVGPYSSVALPVELRISDPDTGTLLKTLYIPDARFTIPGYQGRVQQKLESSFPFSSDSGTLYVYKGARP